MFIQYSRIINFRGLKHGGGTYDKCALDSGWTFSGIWMTKVYCPQQMTYMCASDFRYPVAESDIDELELFTTKPPEFGCLDNCAEHFQQLMGNHGKEMPRTCLDAKSLYLWLIQYV
ncbi:uncharacterized protein LOC123538777 isoform X2 [Mercenaria mercenaria]|uniref:uncharacterized protein LOC123538777 isoform X2 n=1 Tax=Mercenaria mercenaria TaxID=6596 RepID=UPI00234F650E|nr:uncharacterized protein LOC123538777 isoform X2 [Mercenaria mercenaria]